VTVFKKTYRGTLKKNASININTFFMNHDSRYFVLNICS